MNSTLSGMQEPRGNGGVINDFMAFARSTTPEDAKREVERLLRTGKMTQSQFNELSAKARDFARVFNIPI